MRRLAPWQAYLFAGVATVATLGARIALDATFNGFPGILLFVLPIVASAYLGGLRGGLLATFLSCAASQYLVLLPLQPLVFGGAPLRWLQVFIAVAGVFISMLGEGLHRARSRALQSARTRDASQAELRRHAALLANAQRLAGLGIWELDVASGVLTWSEETCRIFGIAPASFGGTREAFHAFIHADDVERIRQLSGLDPSGSGVEYRIVRPDGEVRVVSQRGETTLDSKGRPLRRIGVVMDITERTAALETQRRMAEQLAREKARLLAAQAVAKVGSWETVVATGAVDWSDETHSIFGTNAAEFSPTHEKFLARVHPEDREGVNAAFARSLSSMAPCAVEHRIVMSDGRAKTVEERWQVTRDVGGGATRVLGTCQDVSERMEAAEKYRSLFENSADGIFQNTPEGRMLAANPALARMLGYASPAELVRARIDLANQGYANPALRAEFRGRLEREGSIDGFEYEVRRKDGTLIWVSENVRVVRGDGGKAIRYEGSVQDVTERHRAQEALRRQTVELRVLFDLVPAMIWFKDTENRILRVNQRAASAAGRTIEDIEGRPSAEIYPRDADLYYAADLKVIASGVPLLGTIERLADADGKDVWVETDKVPFFGEDGKVAGVIVMAQDITERKLAEAQLRKTHNQLVEVSRLGGMAEVATEVLHNVGNILNSVNVSASLVVENVRNSRASRMADVVALLREHRDDLADYITSHPKGQHIPGMLEDLSREWVAQQQLLVTELGELHRNVNLIKEVVASQQNHAVAAEPVEKLGVEELVEDAVRVQQGVLTQQHVRLVREFTGLPPIHVARHKAVRILVSLLRNGRQACRHLEPRDRCITLRIARLGSRAVISVSDNGVGIAAENLVRVFAPGYTTHPNARGYGLHSAALAATELGGSLGASSDGPDKGATFTLELPLGIAA